MILFQKLSKQIISKTIKRSDYCTRRNLKVIFFGNDEFSIGPLKKLHNLRKTTETIGKLGVVTTADDKKSRKTEDCRAVSLFAKKNGLSEINWNELKHDLELGGDFDVAVVASFGEFIPAKVINLFSKGAINIHPSLLPRWRGAAPLIHTILSGDQITGISFIEVSKKKFDVGKILYQKEYQVPEKCTTEELGDKLSYEAAELLPYVLDNLSILRTHSKEQDESLSTHAPKISRDSGFVNFSKHRYCEIERMHRALSAKVGVQALWDGKRIKLASVVDTKHTTDSVVCGTCTYSKPEKLLWIKCVDGWLAVDRFQVETKRKGISASSFYNGYIIDKETGKPNELKFQSILP